MGRVLVRGLVWGSQEQFVLVNEVAFFCRISLVINIVALSINEGRQFVVIHLEFHAVACFSDIIFGELFIILY